VNKIHCGREDCGFDTGKPTCPYCTEAKLMTCLPVGLPLDERPNPGSINYEMRLMQYARRERFSGDW